ncbi:MAG TPA: hypothetical protein PLP23_09650 [Panacibacter sp.]|nr:hypothetical protein [Panacibacter sp.]
MRFLFLILLIGISCNSKYDFYETHGVSDLYVIPLYKLYRLSTVSDDRKLTGEAWGLDLKYKSGGFKDNYTNVTDINLTKGVIYGNGKREEGAEPNDWFVIITENRTEKIFENEKDWLNYLSKIGIDSVKLYQTWDLFYKFRDRSILPWYNPSKGIYP